MRLLRSGFSISYAFSVKTIRNFLAAINHVTAGKVTEGTYRIGSVLMNCIKMLDDGKLSLSNNPGYKKEKHSFDKFIEHWNKTAEKL